MSTSHEAGPPADDVELAAYGDLVKQVYNTTDDAIRREWLLRAGHENVRVVRDGARVVGGLILIPMGQWFGGRSVPMNGVAAVAVAPEHRGHGAATALMRAAVQEMAQTGFPLSALYPATQPLYRAAGYERAGGEYRIAIPARYMTGGDRELVVRPATDADVPAMEEAYRRRARSGNGNLDRGPNVWRRIRDPLAARVNGYVVEGASGIEGHVWFVTKETDAPEFKLWCNDLVALTPAAARRLVAFLGDHRSMAGEVGWRSSPGDPLLAVLREQWEAVVRMWDAWMLRICDVGAALSLRGYSPGVSAEVHLDIAADEAVPQNSGRWTLRVAGGRGEAVRGGRGDIRLHVRGLAALYTGFQSPAELRASGFAEGDDAALAVAAAAFTGPHPWMADHF